MPSSKSTYLGCAVDPAETYQSYDDYPFLLILRTPSDDQRDIFKDCEICGSKLNGSGIEEHRCFSCFSVSPFIFYFFLNFILFLNFT